MTGIYCEFDSNFSKNKKKLSTNFGMWTLIVDIDSIRFVVFFSKWENFQLMLEIRIWIIVMNKNLSQIDVLKRRAIHHTGSFYVFGDFKLETSHSE